jgi:hypothetical protein
MKNSAKEAMTVAMTTEIALTTRRVRYVNTVGLSRSGGPLGGRGPGTRPPTGHH